MIGAQPMLTYTGLCGLVVRMLDCRFRSPGFESGVVKKYFCFSYIK